MPKVSVIIPSYNHEKYVAEAIQSVLDQTFQDFEIVITDDGSTDRTVEIIKGFKDPRIRLFCFDKNRGASIAANHCIREACGEYIAVLSSDDVFLPDKLEKQLNFLKKNTSVGAVLGFAEIIDEEGNIFTDSTHFYYDIFKQENRTRFEWLNYFFWHGNALCHPSVLIRMECYRNIGLYDERLAQVPDLDFWIRLCMIYDIYIIPENLIKFRIMRHELNASGSRPETRMRSAAELFFVQKNYLNISSGVDFFKIFPEARRYESTFEKELMPFYFVMLSLERHHKYGILFWLNSFFQLFDNNEKKQNLYNKYDFSTSDFFRLTGKCDIFNFDALWQKNLQLNATTEQLNATTEQLNATTEQLNATTEQLQERNFELESIRATIGWRLISTIYRFIDRVFPMEAKRGRLYLTVRNFFKRSN